MSAGAFQYARYTGDDTGEYFVRIQPETAGLTIGAGTNAAPAGAIAPGATQVRVSGSRRRLGKKARMVRVRFTGAPPDGYLANSVIALPALTPTFYNGCTRGATGTYLGVAVRVVGRSPETQG